MLVKWATVVSVDVLHLWSVDGLSHYGAKPSTVLWPLVRCQAIRSLWLPWGVELWNNDVIFVGCKSTQPSVHRCLVAKCSAMAQGATAEYLLATTQYATSERLPAMAQGITFECMSATAQRATSVSAAHSVTFVSTSWSGVTVGFTINVYASQAEHLSVCPSYSTWRMAGRTKVLPVELKHRKMWTYCQTFFNSYVEIIHWIPWNL